MNTGAHWLLNPTNPDLSNLTMASARMHQLADKLARTALCDSTISDQDAYAVLEVLGGMIRLDPIILAKRAIAPCRSTALPDPQRLTSIELAGEVTRAERGFQATRWTGQPAQTRTKGR